jgi:cell division protease FtsH
MPDTPALKPPEPKHHITIGYTFVALLIFLALQYWLSTSAQVEEIPYSQFQTLLDDGKIADITVDQNTIRGTLKEPLAGGHKEFTAVRVEPAIADKLAGKAAVYKGRAPGYIGPILSWIAPLVIFYLFWAFVVRRMGDKQGMGLMSIGKSKAKVYVETDIKVTFKDVAGVDEAKFELQEVVSFLRDPKSYGRLGARIPKGIMLVGPPGTGKTLLARAVAGEANVPFFSISGSEFVEMFVGVGAARVRDLFEQARQSAPCIIFIDELDALGRSRVASPYGGESEKEQTLNQLLAELDGFDPSVGVILLAATNRPEILDPALLRAGRFDRQVLVDRPDRKGRIDILGVHIGKIRTNKDVDLDAIAGITTGFTGADLANLVNEAALLATRRKADDVTLTDFTAAVERIVAGLEKKSRVLNADERRRVAYHEMGHALVASMLPGVDPVLKVSIIPRGVGALGYTIQRPTEDRFVLAESELQNRITVLMGGRAAESMEFSGDVSTGAADDLQRATEIALEMITRYGMDKTLGQRTYAQPRAAFLGQGPAERNEMGEATAREIDIAVRDLLGDAFAQAIDVLKSRQAELDQGAALLLERETLTVDEFPPLRSHVAPAAKLQAV